MRCPRCGGLKCGGPKCGVPECGGPKCGGPKCGCPKCGCLKCGGVKRGGPMCGSPKCGRRKCGGPKKVDTLKVSTTQGSPPHPNILGVQPPLSDSRSAVDHHSPISGTCLLSPTGPVRHRSRDHGGGVHQRLGRALPQTRLRSSLHQVLAGRNEPRRMQPHAFFIIDRFDTVISRYTMAHATPRPAMRNAGINESEPCSQCSLRTGLSSLVVHWVRRDRRCRTRHRRRNFSLLKCRRMILSSCCCFNFV